MDFYDGFSFPAASPDSGLHDEILVRKASVLKHRKKTALAKRRSRTLCELGSWSYRSGAKERNVPICCGRGRGYTFMKRRSRRLFRRRGKVFDISEDELNPVLREKSFYKKLGMLAYWY